MDLEHDPNLSLTIGHDTEQEWLALRSRRSIVMQLPAFDLCRGDRLSVGGDTLPNVAMVLLATDSDSLFDDVDAALADSDTDVWRVKAGADVAEVARLKSPDLILLDSQIGNMGGIATCIALKQHQESGRHEPAPVALLLDRAVDVFLADASRADGWLIKPLDSLRLQKLARVLRSGETMYESPVMS